MTITDPLPRTISEKGKLPAERFSHPREVVELVDSLIQADKTRASNRTYVQGLIDGNRPYNEGRLKNTQQGWRANVNYREAEGIIQSNRTPYYDLIFEESPCVNIHLDYGKGPQQYEWASIIAEEFHRMLMGWDSIDWHIQLQQSEMMVHGIGAHVRTTALDWRMTTPVSGKVLFPDRTTTDLENLEYFVLRDIRKPHQLYQTVKNEKAAEDLGWNTGAVWKEMGRQMQGFGVTSTEEDAQARMKNGDLGYSATRGNVRLAHMFVTEFDPVGITHYIVGEGGSDEAEYLYKKRHRFESFSDILTIFPYDIGSDGTIHSVKGLGPRIAPFMELSNRIKNHMVDQVLLTSGILLQQQGQLDLSKLHLTRLAGMTILPNGVSPAPTKLSDLNQNALHLERSLQDTLMENTKTYRSSVTEANTRAQRTAFEVSVNQQDQAMLRKSAHNMYYRNWDRELRIIFARATSNNLSDASDNPGVKRALEMQKRCRDRGVPREAFRHAEISAKRSVGAGSASHKLQVLQLLMQVIYPSTDEVSKKNLQRDFIAALANSSLVDRYSAPPELSRLPTEDDALAVAENNMFAVPDGDPPLVTPAQNHSKHLERHLAFGFKTYEKAAQGAMDLEQAVTIISLLLEHSAAHMELLANDPTRKGEFKEMTSQFQQLARLLDQLKQNLDEMMGAEAQEEEQQFSEDYGLKEAKVRGELALKQQKTMGDMHLKELKTQQQMRHKEEKQLQQTGAL